MERGEEEEEEGGISHSISPPVFSPPSPPFPATPGRKRSFFLPSPFFSPTICFYPSLLVFFAAFIPPSNAQVLFSVGGETFFLPSREMMLHPKPLSFPPVFLFFSWGEGENKMHLSLSSSFFSLHFLRMLQRQDSGSMRRRCSFLCLFSVSLQVQCIQGRFWDDQKEVRGVWNPLWFLFSLSSSSA